MPHRRRQVRARRQHAADEPRPRLRRRGRQPAATLEHIGLFTQTAAGPPEKLPRLADYNDDTLPLDLRARAYLHANCTHCHIKWGGGNAEFQLLATLDLKELGIVNVTAAPRQLRHQGREAARARPSGTLADCCTA